MLDLTLTLDDDAARRLATRAARNGRSAAEEARLMLAADLAGEAAPGAPPAPPRSDDSAWDAIRRLKARHGDGVAFQPLDRAEWRDRPADLGD